MITEDIIKALNAEEDPLYIGELVQILNYTKSQILEVLTTLLLVQIVGYKKQRY